MNKDKDNCVVFSQPITQVCFTFDWFVDYFFI